MNHPLFRLQDLGQSVWLDYFHRSMVHSGELEHLIREDGVRGLTSNPSIFAKAIGETSAYDEAIRALARARNSSQEIYEALVVDDMQRAADILRPVHDASDGADGFVSLEVSPHLAADAAATIEEGLRLWNALRRPNVLIKVPATLPGLEAIRRLVAEGVNVNITLLFSLPRYGQVADAYLSGIEDRLASGQSVAHVTSVASFFLSRIDLLVDPMLDELDARGGANAPIARSLRAEVAIASARVAYRTFQQIFTSDRSRRLGARPQRLLWASTAAKRKTDSDLKYVEPLIGPSTINTMTRDTLKAYRDHGDPSIRITADTRKAHKILDKVSELGINLDRVTDQLEQEGVDKFARDYDGSIAAIERKLR